MMVRLILSEVEGQTSWRGINSMLPESGSSQTEQILFDLYDPDYRDWMNVLDVEAETEGDSVTRSYVTKMSLVVLQLNLREISPHGSLRETEELIGDSQFKMPMLPELIPTVPQMAAERWLKLHPESKAATFIARFGIYATFRTHIEFMVEMLDEFKVAKASFERDVDPPKSIWERIVARREEGTL